MRVAAARRIPSLKFTSTLPQSYSRLAKRTMATARPKITLYVDTVSPFAYEAYYILRHDPVFASCAITYIPIFLGGLMHKTGNTPPIRIKNKDKWIGLERLRWASAFAVPMMTDMPPDFPALTLPVMRALCALAPEAEDPAGQERLVRALDVLFPAYWVEGRRTHDLGVLREVLGGVFGGEEAERLITESATTGKKVLLENTERAFADGAFGLPWMFCTNAVGEKEGYWGVDHLGQVAQFLGLDRQKGQAKGWKAML